MLPLLAMPPSKWVGPTLKTHSNPIHGEKPRATAGKPNPRPPRAPAPTQVSGTATLGTTPTWSRTGGRRRTATTAATPRTRRRQRRARTGAAPPPPLPQQPRVCPTANIKVSVLQPFRQRVFGRRRRLGKPKALHVEVCRTQRSSRGSPGTSFKFKQTSARGQSELPALLPDTC